LKATDTKRPPLVVLLVDAEAFEAIEQWTQEVHFPPTELFNCGPHGALPDLFVEWRRGPRFLDRVEHPRSTLIQLSGR